MDLKSHWNDVYLANGPERVSWYQPTASLSLELIRHSAPPPNPAIIDVGGGASTLVDGLLTAGYRRITVLDLSGVALADARKRIGQAAGDVAWESHVTPWGTQQAFTYCLCRYRPVGAELSVRSAA